MSHQSDKMMTLQSEWFTALRGLDPDQVGGDAPEIMIRRVWGGTNTAYRQPADIADDLTDLQVHDMRDKTDVANYIKAAVSDDLETMRLDEEGRDRLCDAPDDGLSYQIWIDNIHRKPEEQPRMTVFRFAPEQLADFADTTQTARDLLVHAECDHAAIDAVATLCQPWFKRAPGDPMQMRLF